MMIIFFSITALVASKVIQNNIRGMYEDSFTERLLLSNALIAKMIESEEVEYYVELMKGLDEEFRKRQVQFYHDREELFRLQDTGADVRRQEELLGKLAAFHKDMDAFKTEAYWKTSNDLKQLRDISHSAFVYVMSDTGLTTEDGEKLYTYIFDADDSGIYDNPFMDGLGTCHVGEKKLEKVYLTKVQMDRVEYYLGDYGELYYAYAPILNHRGEVIAILGTDINLEKMYRNLSRSTFLFNMVFFGSGVIFITLIYIYLSRSITAPLTLLTETAHELAEGNVYSEAPGTALKQQGEIGILAQAISKMSFVYQDMIKSTKNLFTSANSGRLDVRGDASQFKGDIQNVMKQINAAFDATMQYLNSIPAGIFIMGKDFEMYFRNDHYTKYFGDMSAKEFIDSLNFLDGKDGHDSRHQSAPEGGATGVPDPEFSDGTAWINGFCFSVMFKEIALAESSDNSILVIAADITDLIREKENAQAAAEAKSNFLSRMSHEIRTPMNAIIGMTKIADDTEDVSRLKYCLATIGTSSEHLLRIINDVLDMSKIDAGKLELENVPMNLEKTLMKICNIIIDNMEKKNQKFSVVLSKDLELNYFADDLRLSQIITNLLSNSVKFTPENGKITLTVEKTGQDGNTNTLRFSISDTGIGMTAEQIARLFNAFEQADGSISRQFGGTGLGLVISKSIIEKMGGKIWVESTPGSGSVFSFEVRLERAERQEKIIFDGIHPDNIRLLIIESEDDVRHRFMSIVESFGVNADAAKSADEALALVDAAAEANRAYDVIFLDYDMPNMNGVEIVRQLQKRIDKNTVIIITTFVEWRRIEEDARKHSITRYITKPLFPSSILNAISEVVSTTLKSLDIKTSKTGEGINLSGVRILLVEDMDINREIFITLLKNTHISIDIAENGRIAVSKFRENPDLYDLIVMDVQMPEMDGYEATRAIRAMGTTRAMSIPIIAMTANAFKEDIERCLASGMNDHLPKPIDEINMIQKIVDYTKPV